MAEHRARTESGSSAQTSRARRGKRAQGGRSRGAREGAHVAAETDRQARERQQEILALEQALADKTRALADRIATTDRLEQNLRAREKAIAQQEQRAAAAVNRAEQMVAERQRELQRVAGLMRRRSARLAIQAD